MKHFFRFVLLVIISVCSHAEVLPIKALVGPLVIVEIEGNSYLIDSGSNANFIDPKSLTKLQPILTRDQKNDRYINTFNSRSRSEAYKMNLKIGKLAFNDMEAYVVNTQKFDAQTDGISCCDGILGTPFINKYQVLIDRTNKLITVDNKIKDFKNLEEIKFDLEGKDTIVLKCQLGSQRKVNIRLDSGSEAPLIFHRHMVDKLNIREQLFEQNFSGAGIPFLKVNSLKCGKKDLSNLSATYFFGADGALTQDGVDINAGAYFLGDKYGFDFKAKKIFVSKNNLEFSYTKNHFLIDTNYTNKNLGNLSILSQAKALMFKSCVERSGFESCIKKVCELEDRKICSAKDSMSPLDDFVNFYFEVKTPDCSIDRVVEELRSRPVRYNFCWYKLYELNFKKDIVNEAAISLPLKFKKYESEVDLVEDWSVESLTKNYYCLSVYQNLINQESLPASLFAMSVKGLTFSKKSFQGYESWLASKEGKLCALSVKDSLGVEVNSKISIAKNYKIIISPWTIIGDGTDLFAMHRGRTLSHEFNHFLFDKAPEIKEQALSDWKKLDASGKEKFKKQHPSYDFKNENILIKEFYSYENENETDFVVR